MSDNITAEIERIIAQQFDENWKAKDRCPRFPTTPLCWSAKSGGASCHACMSAADGHDAHFFKLCERCDGEGYVGEGIPRPPCPVCGGKGTESERSEEEA